MGERQKIDWSLQDKELLLLLEKRQALDKEILAVEEVVSSYQLLRANERLQNIPRLSELELLYETGKKVS